MNNCKTCKWWGTKDDRYWDICFPVDPVTYESPKSEEEVIRLYGYMVKTCTSPKIVFYQRPDRDGATVCDGSQYTASLKTAEYFGCVQYEKKPL